MIDAWKGVTGAQWRDGNTDLAVGTERPEGPNLLISYRSFSIVERAPRRQKVSPFVRILSTASSLGVFVESLRRMENLSPGNDEASSRHLATISLDEISPRCIADPSPNLFLLRDYARVYRVNRYPGEFERSRLVFRRISFLAERYEARSNHPLILEPGHLQRREIVIS